ncbi:MAG: TldD/PmbA family protein [Candidatus Brocadia sp. AMX2]|uniref:Metalloprotease TldD/E C-terminal domain-containing protein n=1 Tax=Candidatus Brocadia sinica JPN1 TaxID=1197129 RepID=A0ABQ0JXP7_9BACT|nr:MULTISPECIES: TldD/PmbA family protein [Brocadia]KXK28860.1 MAG: putative protease [Candidatus Brocadia sinica]MBC6932613.1 TldD/PmbA family protein [Candidatus Brocadia sp.]MBL1169897.1 TldD/PmbA family protein [Candidatus Brocadia sp. AMX1]NOG40649.1 TldD/PmbA family protein [Planctomycetota bacterium]KAA0244769.1 MAG: TldD/PmbA family protein [Candidatus Brocadia sp. AMX2]
MISIEELQSCVRNGIDFVKKQKDVIDAEIFASWNEQITVRLNYTSDIPCSGVQEPKSTQLSGIGLLVVFKTGKEIKIGFGSASHTITPKGIVEAFNKAKKNKIHDSDFKSLPVSIGKPVLENYHDPAVMEISDEAIIDLGWRGLKGALTEYNQKHFIKSIIVGGDVTIKKERMAIVNTKGIDDFDESTILTTNITSMIEMERVKGTGWNTSTHLSGFYPEEAGRESAESAIRTIGGERIAAGTYNVVFGRQPVTDLFTNLVIPALSLSSINTSDTPFLGKLGQKIASELLTVYDDGTIKGAIGSKKISCEGIPTGRTDLIHNGFLVGFLANNYLSKKLANKIVSFTPRNGFRFEKGGRNYTMQPQICPTNIVIGGKEEVPSQSLLSKINDGIYIGRIWYTYPINGLAAGDFTSTIIADSYLVKGGKIVKPLKPNTVRINNNITDILDKIIAVSNDKRQTVVWGGEEVVLAPEIAVQDIKLENISDFIS